jgi:hypothetical protein
VDDIDEIVRLVRFDEWQTTHAGEREVKKALGHDVGVEGRGSGG